MYKDRCVDTCTRMYAYASMRAHTLGCMCHVYRMYGCVCTQVQCAKELAAAHTMSHHHTYYVTSSYILCHIIIHTMYVCTQVQYAKELAAAQQQLVDDCGNLQLLLKDEKQRREREAQEVIRMSTMAKATY